MTHGAIHWSECITGDVEAAKAYYGAVAGWTFDAMPMDGGLTYWIAMDGIRPVGGMMSLEALPEGASPRWMTYIEVADIAAAVEAARAAGGRVERQPWDVPGVGRIALIADPGGALAGYVEPPTAGAG